MPSVALVLLSGRSVLFVLFYELLIGWGLSALLLGFALPDLEQHQAVSDCTGCTVTFHLSSGSLPYIVCAITRVCAVLMHTQVVGPYLGHSTRPLGPGSCTESGLSLLRSATPESGCLCWLLLSQSQTMRWFVVDFHANIK